MLTAWPSEDHAVVLLVGPHNTKPGDVYARLLDALGVEVSADERGKPSCCDNEGLPAVDEVRAEAIRDAVENSARRPRRRR